jgi:hypothetical protein
MDFLTEEENGDGNFLNEDVIELNRLWRNELNALEILPYQPQLIQDVLQLLHQQQVSEKKEMRAFIMNDYFHLIFLPLFSSNLLAHCSSLIGDY